MDSKLDEQQGPPSYEENAGFFSKILFLWLNPLLNLGYKRVLNANDLPQLSNCDRSDTIYNKINDKWTKNKQKTSTPSLFRTMATSFGLPFCLAAILKLIHDICQFVGPVMLEKITIFISDTSIIEKKDGLIYAAIMFFSAIIQSVCLRNYFYLCFRTGLRLRSSCITMVYNKSLRLSVASRAKYNQGEIMNLMEVDSQKFQDTTSYLQTIWSGPFQIIGSLILLWRQLGVATLAGVVVMIIMIPFTKWIAKKLAGIQRELMKVKDERIHISSEALEGIKLIKLQAWERSFLEKISGIRGAEIKVLRKYIIVQTISQCMWTATPYMVSTFTFFIFALLNGELTTAKAFTSISLFNILRFPLTRFPETINQVAECMVSMDRVQRFLLAEEVEIPSRENRDSIGISVKEGNFVWTEPLKKKQKKPQQQKKCGGRKVIPEEEVTDEEYEPFVLKDIDLNCEKNQLTAIVGHVGCGKSSLLNSILGEMPKKDPDVNLNDMIHIRGSIGYVPQTPFIMNATLRDNILFGSEYNEDLYERVLEACCLKPDIAILPAGDMTEIGEKGINLSGGQKTRISLARAVYQNHDIYLLDDPLSAVDAHVGRAIFRNCIRGLLKNKCVILVSHALEYLPVCDQVLVMEKGAIVDAGSYQDIADKKTGVLASLLQAQAEAQAQTAQDDTVSSPVTPIAEEGTFKPLEEITDVSTVEVAKEPAASSESGAEKTPTEEKKGDLTTVETRVEGQVKKSVYKMYFTAAGGACVIFWVLVTFMITEVAHAINDYWLTYWNNKTGGHSSLWYVGIYALLALFYVIVITIRYIATYFTGLRASSALHDSLLQGIFRSPMSFFDQTPLGRITNRVSKDIYTVDKTLPGVFQSFLNCLFSVIATLVVILLAMPIFILVIIPLTFYYVYEGKFYLKSSREIKRLDSISRSPIYANFGETLDGTPVIRAYQKQQQFIEKNYQLLDLNQRAYFIISSSNCWLGIRLEFAGTVIIGATALLAVLLRDPANTTFTSMAALAISYSLNITQALNWVVRMTTDMETQIVAVERIEEYSTLPSEAPARIEDHIPPTEWPSQGDIVIDNLTMRYRPELEPVLKSLSLHIQPGEKIGVVGRTGAGKSSLILCLMRIIELEGGSITIDGLNIKEMGLEDLRSKIAIIPQEPLLFSGTIRANLDPQGKYTDEEIWSSLERAQMKNVVVEAPNGLDTIVEEHGTNYSVGQRQLLCVARALLRKSKVILMDEATASIDLETDMKIQKTIRNEFNESTVITIAHRIHTIIDSDRVVVLEMGELKEFDKPSVLLSDTSSMFSQLVEKSKEIE